MLSKKNQTIAFAELPNSQYGAPDFAVNATATSSLTVTFSADGACTVSGNTVHLTAAGSCTITAYQPGNDEYNQAPDVSQTFSIAPEDITAEVTVFRGGYTFNPVTGRFAQNVVVQNNSGSTFTGPISLVLDGLAGATGLFVLSGYTDELAPPVSPYLSNLAAGFAPGQQFTFGIQFTDPAKAPISYSFRVLAGPGAR